MSVWMNHTTAKNNRWFQKGKPKVVLSSGMLDGNPCLLNILIVTIIAGAVSRVVIHPRSAAITSPINARTLPDEENGTSMMRANKRE